MATDPGGYLFFYFIGSIMYSGAMQFTPSVTFYEESLHVKNSTVLMLSRYRHLYTCEEWGCLIW